MKQMYKAIPFSPDTTLSKTITATDTTIYVTNPSLLPDAPNYATIGTIEDTAETILYTGKTSNSVTGCTRGIEGKAIAWGAGEPIARNYTNKDHEVFIDNLNELNDCLKNVNNDFYSLGITNSEGIGSVIIGHNFASGSQCVAIGFKNNGLNDYSLTVGQNNENNSLAGCIVGFDNIIGIDKDTSEPFEANCAIGESNYVHAPIAIAIGGSNEVSGAFGYAEGTGNLASGYASHAQNINTIANVSYSTAIGKYNKQMSNGDLFAIGKGTSEAARSNIFRVSSSAIYGTGTYNTSGADYAEYYLWVDQNPNNEDRVGLFVTFAKGSEIRIANANDNYILGVVSGNPSVIGNSYNDHWHGMYLKDHFDRIIYEEVNGEMQPKINPEYDPTKSFIGREKRPEWATIGTHGQLSVYDDGSCQVDGYCKAGDNGIATSAKKGVNTYRVIGRLTDNIIKIQIK